MNFKEKLLEDLKSAMREKDEIRKNTVTMIRSAILQVEKDNKVTLDESGIIDVIAKEVKKRKDSLPDYEKSNREDLIGNLKKEIEILMQYLPEQMSEQEVEQIVKQVIKETGASTMKDMGKVMSAVQPKVRGRADGKIVSQYVKQYLG
jgi:uncharacterized protein YqeY